jgi:cystathionine gamma-synthase
MSGGDAVSRPRAADYGDTNLDTLLIHAGQHADPSTGAIIPPVYMTSTYVQDRVGQHKGYDYSRTDNPTRHALEVQLAAIEGADHGIAFSSGMAAASTMLQTLQPGDHVVCVNDVYGGTYRLFTKVLERHAGLSFTFISMRDAAELAESMTPATRLVWVETPTNPLLNVIDIAEVADITHARGARLCVDNTFATPFLQQPLAHGADVVAHSTTKYLGGHSDVVGGALVLNDDALAAELRFLQNAVGAVPGPMDAWLVTRGIKTLAVRMERHCSNALAITHMLAERDDVIDVRYPGHASHPHSEVVQKQMRAGGGMVSFRPAGGVERARALVEQTRFFRLAESLGGVESLIELPGAMTHQTLEGSPLEVPADLVRMSVGIEHPADLLADLAEALDATASLVNRAGAGVI